MDSSTSGVFDKLENFGDTFKQYTANTLAPPDKAILLMAKERRAALGAPTPSEVFSMLQTDVVDVASNPQKAIKKASGQSLPTQNAALAGLSQHYKRVEVHYNPSTMTFRGVGGDYVQMSGGMGSMAENQIQQMTMDVSTTLSCQLIFANISLSDAFFYNKAEGGAFWAALGAGKSAVEALSSKLSDKAKAFFDKSRSVEKYVDGFMGALHNSYTRRMFFLWGNNTFFGELTRANGSFKMFNTRGEPVLATVDIEIRQDYDERFEKIWRKRFEKVFQEVSNV